VQQKKITQPNDQACSLTTPLPTTPKPHQHTKTVAWLLCKKTFGKWKYGVHSARSNAQQQQQQHGRARSHSAAMGRGAHALDGARAI
jgi:hypothetical protein